MRKGICNMQYKVIYINTTYSITALAYSSPDLSWAFLVVPIAVSKTFENIIIGRQKGYIVSLQVSLNIFIQQIVHEGPQHQTLAHTIKIWNWLPGMIFLQCYKMAGFKKLSSNFPKVSNVLVIPLVLHTSVSLYVCLRQTVEVARAEVSCPECIKRVSG